jgi:hypothetical protein
VLVLLEHLDAVRAEIRGNPLTIQQLAGRRLARRRRWHLSKERNRDNI